MSSSDLELSIIHQVWSPTMYPPFEEDSNSSFSSLSTTTLGFKTTETEDNDADEEEKLCAVCGDKANGYHFHVLTCEGCKGFFRRSISKGLHFSCPFTRTCPVTKDKRRRCQACRLQKCLNVGMRKDMIMTDEALAMRRALRSKRKQERLHRLQRVAEVGSLTEEQKQLISTLIDANNKHFDTTYSQFVNYRPQMKIQRITWENSPIHSPPSYCPGSPFSSVNSLQSTDLDMSPNTLTLLDTILSSDTVNELPHFADLSTFMIKQVIQFSKEIPTFKNLPIDDQISLLKGATMEVSQIQFNKVFNLDTRIWECGKIKITVKDASNSGFQQLYLDLVQKFHINLRKLNLHEAEYVLMEALALFSPDRTGIIEKNVIDEFQEKIALTLQSYINYHHPLPDGRFLYGKLLASLAELHSLNAESTRQLLHIQDLTDDAMTPLMKEIFS
ncbi:nuclear receptor subfamily 1 group I member 3 [Rhinophrynus dorsalis]